MSRSPFAVVVPALLAVLALGVAACGQGGTKPAAAARPCARHGSAFARPCIPASASASPSASATGSSPAPGGGGPPGKALSAIAEGAAALFALGGDSQYPAEGPCVTARPFLA